MKKNKILYSTNLNTYIKEYKLSKGKDIQQRATEIKNKDYDRIFSVENNTILKNSTYIIYGFTNIRYEEDDNVESILYRTIELNNFKDLVKVMHDKQDVKDYTITIENRDLLIKAKTNFFDTYRITKPNVTYIVREIKDPEKFDKNFSNYVKRGAFYQNSKTDKYIKERTRAIGKDIEKELKKER